MFHSGMHRRRHCFSRLIDFEYIRCSTDKTRKSYSIVKRLRKPGQKSKNETIHTDETRALNDAYKSGVLLSDEADTAFKKIIEKLYEQNRQDLPCNRANLKLKDKYWEERFEDKANKDPRACEARLNRGVEALGKLSIYSATRQEMQKQLNNAKNPREAVDVINGLLKYIGRTKIKLHRQRKPRRTVRHVTLSQFKSFVSALNEEERILCWVAMTTGLRLGEVFAIKKGSFHPKAKLIRVREQMKLDGKFYETKTANSRRVPVLDEGIAWIEKFINIPDDRKLKLRRKRWSDIVKNASRTALGTKNVLTFHDLRHSYAIHLIIP